MSVEKFFFLFKSGVNSSRVLSFLKIKLVNYFNGIHKAVQETIFERSYAYMYYIYVLVSVLSVVVDA